MEYIHSKNYLHRDIKPDNILFSKDLSQVKIIDFNVSKKHNDRLMMTKTGLEEWGAPEMFQNSQYNNKVDLWSLGCVVYYMLTGL